MSRGARKEVYLICGGQYHDMDFARLELLKLLAENERHRVHVAEDFADVATLEAAGLLISYTCNIAPTRAEQQALADYLSGGGRWFALHGTNSILELLEGRGWDAPQSAPLLMELLGSQFIAHPPIQKHTISVADPAHPLVAGIEAFETDDEIYLCDYHGERQCLLETRFSGEAPGFTRSDWHDATPREVFYLRPYGDGAVLYLTLGHCRGHYDMQPLMDYYPRIERGSWQLPVFYELLRRGIRWTGRELDA